MHNGKEKITYIKQWGRRENLHLYTVGREDIAYKQLQSSITRSRQKPRQCSEANERSASRSMKKLETNKICLCLPSIPFIIPIRHSPSFSFLLWIEYTYNCNSNYEMTVRWRKNSHTNDSNPKYSQNLERWDEDNIHETC